mgnify:CR=1 FL=1|tara:strand:- start:32447 stop:32689 length:243 start_codon:yes stop_codon:yes gene_type:complete
MTKDFTTRATNIYWSYRWNRTDNPVVFFCNPKVNTNVIYTLEELQNIVSRSDKENTFIPIPRNVMQNALDAYDVKLTLAA